MMKKLILVVLLATLLIGTTSAQTNYAVQTGNWAVASTWGNGVPDDSEEIKISNVDDLTVTVNSNVGNIAGNKIDTTQGGKLLITDGGYLGSGREMHIGDAGATGSSYDVGYLEITGGTLDITDSASYNGKLQVGYKGGGDGTCTISGGTLMGNIGRLYVGCASSDGSIGLFNVVGASATINLGGAMYVANDSSTSSGNTGHGTVQFTLTAAASVSKIQVDKAVIDSQNEALAIADLVVSLTGAAPTLPLLLIESTGSSSVTGMFDSLLVKDAGGNPLGGYSLTYTYGTGGNDIALIPEPATVVLLGLGSLIAVRRRKK